MGRSAGRVLLALLGAAWGFAQIQHQVSVVNISVPVRVYDGANFVDSLGLEDFEISEDGKPQPVEAVYLIRGGALKRQEGAPGAPAPETHGNYVLLFQVAEYLPEIDKAVDLFFAEVCRPGDAVDIVTPLRTLRLRHRIDTPEKVRKAQTEVKARLKNDALILSGSYRSIIEDMFGHLQKDEESENTTSTATGRTWTGSRSCGRSITRRWPPSPPTSKPGPGPSTPSSSISGSRCRSSTIARSSETS